MKLDNLDSWFYKDHIYLMLGIGFKPHFWGARIHIGPNHPIYPKGILVNFLNLLAHLQEKILDEVWRNKWNCDSQRILAIEGWA